MANIQARGEPINGDLLWLQQQHNHRSYALFTNQNIDRVINARRSDWKLWEHIRSLQNEKIDEQVFEYIRNAGFAGVFETGFHKLDHGLVTALVERWRPETHTFHFPVGEATITLQDVQVLWGLPIDGPVVSGLWVSMKRHEWMHRCEIMLGFEPDEDDISAGGQIKISTLMRHLSDELYYDAESLQQRARLYILALIGGHLFADSSSKSVSLNYLSNIEDLSVEGRQSWGSAVLAFLYRQLCIASEDATCKSIAGALNLLQIWAWERMPCIAPAIRSGRGGREYNFTESYASRWNATMSYIGAPSHVVTPFRSAFTALQDDQFVWCPYDNILQLLPQDCTQDSDIWSYCGWILFWHIAEPHLPHRVTRQFGWIQGIPNETLLLSPQEHWELHDLTRQGRPNTDWEAFHGEKISRWDRRNDFVYQGDPGVTIAPSYKQWFYARTVLSPVNPGLPTPANRYPEWGGRQHLYEEGIREMHNRALDRVQTQPETQTFMQDFLSIPEQLMGYGRNDDRINYGSQSYQFPSYNYPYNPSSNPRMPTYPAYSPVNNPDSFYASAHPVFSQPRPRPSSSTPMPHPPFFTPAPPTQDFAGSSYNLFNMDASTLAPDYHQFSPISMQNLGSTSQHPSSSRQQRQIYLGDDDNDDDDEADDNNDNDVEEPPQQVVPINRRGNRRDARRRGCGTGGHF